VVFPRSICYFGGIGKPRNLVVDALPAEAQILRHNVQGNRLAEGESSGTK
jgi:hypothetical protein